MEGGDIRPPPSTGRSSRSPSTARVNYSMFLFSALVPIRGMSTVDCSDLAERRRYYGCGDRYVRLSDIPSWLDYCRHAPGVGTGTRASAVSPPTVVADNQLAERVSFWRGDITLLEVDAIVNAANRSLLGGGGVDGAVHRAAGPELRAECATLGGCETGDAKLTGGYGLPARHVLHTVGPVGEQPQLLRACYLRCLQLARLHRLRSLAFPCVSTGVFGYPQEAAARVALQTVREQLEQGAELPERVVFCLFLESDVIAYMRQLPVFFPVNK